MSQLSLSLTRSGSDEGEFSARIRSQEFSGLEKCFVRVSQLKESAVRFSSYPFPSDRSVCIEGGYYSDDLENLEQVHLHISARSIGHRGEVVLRVLLATPIDTGILKSYSQLICEIPTTYENVGQISTAIGKLCEGEMESCILELPELP